MGVRSNMMSTDTWEINSHSALTQHLSRGNGCILSQSRCFCRDQIVSLFNHGSTPDGLRNFGNCGLRARLRSEYLQAQKDNISGETKHRKCRKEIGSPTKEDLYKFQCRFRIEPEISHDSPLPTQAWACDGWRFRRMRVEVNRGHLESFSLLSIAVTV